MAESLERVLMMHLKTLQKRKQSFSQVKIKEEKVVVLAYKQLPADKFDSQIKLFEAVAITMTQTGGGVMQFKGIKLVLLE